MCHWSLSEYEQAGLEMWLDGTPFRYYLDIFIYMFSDYCTGAIRRRMYVRFEQNLEENVELCKGPQHERWGPPTIPVSPPPCGVKGGSSKGVPILGGMNLWCSLSCQRYVMCMHENDLH